jgi:LacI family transcriptional regulator
MSNPRESDQKKRHVAVRLELEWLQRHHTAIFAGAAKYARQQGWNLTIDEYVEESLTDLVPSDIPFDGIIARATEKLAHRAAHLQIPLVNVWYSSPIRDRVPGVFPDRSAVGRMCAEHLISRGLHTFAALGTIDDQAQNLEVAVFRSTLAEAGFDCTLAFTPMHAQASFAQWRRTQQVIVKWMDTWQRPVGVYIAPIDLSRCVTQICHARGWNVPGEVAIITSDNEQTICEMPQPTLTSIDVGYERVGYEAARLLDHLMLVRDEAKVAKGAAIPERNVEHVFLPPQGLVVRESTDFVAVNDAETAAALEFISTHSHLPIRVADVARAVAMEERTLQLRFRKFLNRPVADEIRRVRLERAKRELTQSDRSLAEIARSVGFREPQRMYDVFVRELGVSPSQYRKDRRIDP